LLLFGKKLLYLQPESNIKNKEKMKKIYVFLAFIAMTLGLNAQSFLITTVDGDTISTEVKYIVDERDDIRLDFIHLKNITENPIEVRMQIERLELASNAEVLLCFGGTCSLDTIASVEQIITINPDEEYTGFDLEYRYENSNRSIVKVNLLDPATMSIIQTFKVIYYNGEALSTVEKSTPLSIDIYPNPVATNASIRYSVPRNYTTATVTIKNMLGKVVKTIDVNGGASGKVNINTENLPSGIYFCSITANDAILSTKKMIVKH
jgi:hypothetical protein